jgi:UDP-N-acetylmuramyl tripeptide synthase
VNIHIKTILAYSAKKKNTNIAAECSVMNPETNSDSASAKSKGALFVSAIHPIKNIINTGSKGKATITTFCASILTVKFKLPVNKTTNNIAELSISS